LKNRQVVSANPTRMEEGVRALLDPGIQSLISVPIFVGDSWWGSLGFDCVREREGGDAEKDSAFGRWPTCSAPPSCGKGHKTS